MRIQFYLVCILILLNVSLFAVTDASQSWQIGTGEIIEAAFSPNGDQIAVAGNTGVFIVERENFKIKSLFKNEEGFEIVKWSPNGQILFFAKINNEFINNQNEFGYFSEDNYIYNKNTESISNFTNKVVWEIFTSSNLLSKSILLEKDNLFHFSVDSTDVLFLQRNEGYTIIDLETKIVRKPILEQISDSFEAGFANKSDYLVLFKTISSNDNSMDDLLIVFANKDTFEVIDEIMIKDKTNQDVDIITIDGKYLFKSRKTYNVASRFNTYEIIDINSGKTTTLDQNLIVDIAPVQIDLFKYQYLPENQTFVVVKTGGYSFSRILVKNASDGSIIEGAHLKLLSKFIQPLSQDGSLFLSGDHFKDFSHRILPPSYDLYVFDWRNKTYQHLLPQSAPKLITFTNNPDSQFFIHTNRITNQFYYESANGDLPLKIIPNKYSNPITEIWSPDEHSLVSELQNKPFYEIGTFSYDNAMFASPIEPISATQTQINLYDTNSWEIAHELPIDATNVVSSIAFSPDIQLFLVTHKAIDIWNANTGEKIQTITHHDGKVFYAYFSTDSKRILSTGSDGKVIESNLSANSSNTLIQESSPVIFADYLADETQIIYTLNDGISKVLNLSNNNIIKTIPATLTDNSFRAVKLSADERFIIVGNQIWNIVTPELINTIAEHAEPIEDLQVSSDGKWVASRHSDFTARVWSTDEIYQQHSSVNIFENYY